MFQTVRISMPLVLLAVAMFMAKGTVAGEYILISGKGVDVCEAYKKSLNDEKPNTAMACGRFVKVNDISQPAWERPPDELFQNGKSLYGVFLKFSEYLWGRDANPASYFVVTKINKWTGSASQLRETHASYLRNRESVWRRGEPYVAKFDIDNDGKEETVYYENSCGGYGSRLAVVNDNDEGINFAKTELITFHPGLDKNKELVRKVNKNEKSISIFYKKAGIRPVSSPLNQFDYSVLFYKGTTYIDQWNGVGREYGRKKYYEGSRLNVFEPGVDGDKQKCSYKFNVK
jgi:hypothetical protein